MSFSLEDFYGVATYKAEDYPQSWQPIPVLSVETNLFYRDEEDGERKAGSINLYKVTRHDNMWTSCDNICQDSSEVGEALQEVLRPAGFDDIDEDFLYAGNLFIVSWFEIEEEYRKKW